LGRIEYPIGTPGLFTEFVPLDEDELEEELEDELELELDVDDELEDELELDDELEPPPEEVSPPPQAVRPSASKTTPPYRNGCFFKFIIMIGALYGLLRLVQVSGIYFVSIFSASGPQKSVVLKVTTYAT
jgi:hypothetical protein